MHYKHIRHAHTKKLLRNALQSSLLTKLPLLSTKWIQNTLQSVLGGEMVHVPSSCQARMSINFGGGFCFKDATRFVTSLTWRFLVCPC